MGKKKEYDYFEAFVSLGEFSFKAAKMLNETVKGFDKIDIEEEVVKMHEVEHTADIAKHQLLNQLLKEFLPPIEREDIMSLSQGIDDVTDAVEDVLMHANMFNVKEIPEEVIAFTELIVECCKSMNVALKELKNFKKSKTLHQEIIEINRLEEEGDALYTKAVKRLYQEVTDPIYIIAFTEIYRKLEKCCDSCEDVANDMESIILKNS